MTSTSSASRRVRGSRPTSSRARPARSTHWVRRTRRSEEIAQARILQRTLFDAGFAGITYPVEYGGRGLTAAHDLAFRQEAKDFVTPNFGGAGWVTFGPIGQSLLAHAPTPFLRHHIPQMLAGEELWCQFYSEPDAGSDLAGMRTSAVRDGDRWILNGSKIWTTGGNHADYAMCLARTELGRAQASGADLVCRVDHRARGRGPSDQADQRRHRVLPGVPRRCRRVRRRTSSATSTRAGRSPRRCWCSSAVPASPAARPIEPHELAPDLVAMARRNGRPDDPVVRQAIAQAHINDYAQYQLGRRVAALLQSSDDPQPAIAAYSKLASGHVRADPRPVGVGCRRPQRGWPGRIRDRTRS